MRHMDGQWKVTIDRDRLEMPMRDAREVPLVKSPMAITPHCEQM